jgi:hypothetical protein
VKTFTFKMSSLTTILLVLGLAYFAAWTRTPTLGIDVILDYDPWWQYRYAKDILDSNFNPPEWDLLSFFPPGRPETITGWHYTMVFFYKFLSLFIPSMTFMEAAKLSSVIMVGLGIIPAFLLGRELSNKWGGLLTGLIAIAAPTFVGVSMAGYCDTDVVVVFYTFLSIFSVFLAIKKNKIHYYAFATLVTLWLIFNWWFGWYIILFFTLYIPAFLVFRLLENMVHDKKFVLDIGKLLEDSKSTLFPLIILLVILNVAGLLLGMGTLFDIFGAGIRFLTGGAQIVNVSVAELQPINIFTRNGFLQVAGRVGLIPMVIAIFGLPIIAVYKIVKKVKISLIEIFLFMWMALTFYLILHGVRFSLLFTCATAASAGYVVGNLIDVVKKTDQIFFKSTVFGLILFISLMSMSDVTQMGLQSSGMQVGQNWIEMLEWLKSNADPKAIVTTWWDPGHIIAGYTDLRVHGDGAHCGPGECIPYSHNTRIQDMGRIMSTSDEEEALSLLEKYKQLSPEDCEKVKEKYGDIVPDEACEQASEIYFIASSDLIGKFTWMNYFGGFRAPISSNYDFTRNPGVCCASTPKSEPGQVSCGEFADQGRGVWVWCPWIFSLKEQKQDQDGNPIFVYDYSGLSISLIQKGGQLIPVYNNQFLVNYLSFFYEGERQDIRLSNLNTTLEKINGLVWIQPDFRSMIYFAPAIKDSVFTRAFLYEGEGLEKFEPVFSNSEIRLYKVSLD